MAFDPVAAELMPHKVVPVDICGTGGRPSYLPSAVPGRSDLSPTFPAFGAPTAHGAARNGRRCSVPFRCATPGIVSLPANWLQQRHRHLTACVIIVLSGELERFSYAGRLRARAGEILLQPSLDCHSDRAGLTGCTLIVLDWEPVFSVGGIYRGAPTPEWPRLFAHAPEMLRATIRDCISSASGPGHMLSLESRAAALLRDGKAQVGAIATRLAVSREQLSRRFQREYGMPPVTFRNEMRTRNAIERILRTKEKLCAIAIDTGFSDQPHMTRSITRMTGRSPDDWRKSAF
jgi:AraC-like DNA-binding protein